jgi:hypothetical protein
MPASQPSAAIVLTIQGLVPSFKNRKRVGGLTRWGPDLWKGTPTLVTRQDVKRRMGEIIRAFELALRSACPTGADATPTGCSGLSWIASSLPEDDCWTEIEIGSVRTVLVPKGQEGATVTIERLVDA